jgi:hypothetical protein
MHHAKNVEMDDIMTKTFLVEERVLRVRMENTMSSTLFSSHSDEAELSF